MGLSQWIYSLDSHFENSITISDKCRNLLKNCVDCIDNVYINAPGFLNLATFEFIEIEVPEIYSIINEFEIELRILEQQNKRALVIMETLSACSDIDGILVQGFDEVREKAHLEFEWSYSTYKRRLESFMPTFNQLIKKIQRKINEINERIETRNIVNSMDIDEERIGAIDVIGGVNVDFEGGNFANSDIWTLD